MKICSLILLIFLPIASFATAQDNKNSSVSEVIRPHLWYYQTDSKDSRYRSIDPHKVVNTKAKYELLNQQELTIVDSCNGQNMVRTNSHFSKNGILDSDKSYGFLFILDENNKISQKLNAANLMGAKFNTDCSKIIIWYKNKLKIISENRSIDYTLPSPVRSLLDVLPYKNQLFAIVNIKDHPSTVVELLVMENQLTYKSIFDKEYVSYLKKSYDEQYLFLFDSRDKIYALTKDHQLVIVCEGKNPEYLTNGFCANSNNLSNSETYSISIEKDSKEVFNIRHAAFPKPIDESHFIYEKLEGSNEVSLHIFDMKTLTTKRFSAEQRVGLFNFKVFNGTVFSYFNNTYESQTILSFSHDGAERVFYKRQSHSQNKNLTIRRHLVNSTKNFIYPGYLYAKEGRKAKGVVVFIQGGGCHLTVPYSIGRYRPEFVDVLNAGYDIFSVSYRNNDFAIPEYKPVLLTPETCGTDEVDDIVAGGNYVKSIYGDLPVFLWGHSHGGYLTNLTVTKHYDKFNWSGAISGAGMWVYSNQFQPTFMAEKYNPDRAPLDYVDNLITPLYVYHGRRDGNVNFEHTLELLRKYSLVIKTGDGSFINPFEEGPINEYYESENGKLKVYAPFNEWHHIDKPENYIIWINHITEHLNSLSDNSI